MRTKDISYMTEERRLKTAPQKRQKAQHLVRSFISCEADSGGAARIGNTELVAWLGIPRNKKCRQRKKTQASERVYAVVLQTIDSRTNG